MKRPSAAQALAPAILLTAAFGLCGCGALDRFANVGKAPALSAIEDPTAQPGYKPVRMPMPTPLPTSYAANSLWRQGSRAFFKDQRAAQVGDIVTILVNIADAADLKNQSTEGRTGSQTMGMPNMFGLEGALPHILSQASAASLVSTNSNGTATGTGQIQRNETVTLRLAGEVTQVLPNGNLVVMARQEVRVNSELRELQLSGVIRPQDIASDNTVADERLAEARISYGGRGQLTDVQTPRYGEQVLDALLPF